MNFRGFERLAREFGLGENLGNFVNFRRDFGENLRNFVNFRLNFRRFHCDLRENLTHFRGFYSLSLSLSFAAKPCGSGLCATFSASVNGKTDLRLTSL